MASQGIQEEAEIDFDDWTPVLSGKGRVRAGGSVLDSQSSKRELEENSSDEGNRVVRSKVESEEIKNNS